MKMTKLIAGTLAVLMLCSCSADKNTEKPKGKATDAEAAYAKLADGIAVWQNARAISLSVNGSLLSTYEDMPSAVVLSGVHQEQPSTSGKDIYSMISYSYGDGYYYDYYYMTDSNRYVATMEGGSTSEENMEEPVSMVEELTAEDFATFTTYGTPILAFEADLIETATMEETEAGVTYHFIMDAKDAAEETLALLEHIQYINTTAAEITCKTSKMTCDVSFVGDQLVTVAYNVNCEMTSEGEVMTTNYRFTHMLNALDEDVSFELPNFDMVLAGELQ